MNTDGGQAFIPPTPPASLSGYKFNDLNNNHIWDQPTEPGIPNWEIHVYAQVEGGIVVNTHYTTDSNGFYLVDNITFGNWYVGEHLGPNNPTPPPDLLPGWTQTYPNSVVNVAPGAVSSLITGFPAEIQAAIGPAHLAAWGWIVTLTEANPDQTNVNFGNVNNGCLTITKSVVQDVVNPAALDGSFVIHVVGPSYPAGTDLTFTLTDGAITGTNPQTLNNLIPGNYTLTEPTLPAGWSNTSGLGVVAVSAGATCATATVVNSFADGCLTITKSVVQDVVNPAALDGSFVIHVVGPSYPAGTDLTFTLTDGAITGTNPQTLNNLIPGNYTLTEPTLPAGWSNTSGLGVVAVSAGATCATATVVNSFADGCLTITKSVVQDVVNPAALDGSFVIHVVGPSYPAGTDLTFTLTDGAITGTNPQTLNNLIPGNYTLTEPTLPAGWSNTSGLGVVAVSAGATCATATVVNTFADGCLTITKSVVQDVVNPAALDGSFVIHVVGPSYPAGTDLTFTLTDGAITGTNPQTLNNLIPGNYTLTEPTLPAGWSNTSGLGVVAVSAGATCATATVVNTFADGCLTVTKSVVQDVVNPAALDGSFVIHVVGPSYPAGTDLTFTLTDGAITGTNPQTLNNLIPGNYTLTEPTLPAGWSNTSGLGVVAVSAGATCATATVVNTFADGCLTVTKVVDLTGYVFPDTINVTFTATVTGPSYPGGTSHDFVVTNGVLSGSPWTLNNLIPGTYNVTESDPGIMWTVTGGGDVEVSAGATCATSTITNTIKLPNTTMSTVVYVYDTLTGNVELTITDTNDGDVPLTDAHIHVRLLVGGVETVFDSYDWSDVTGFSGGNSDDIMDPGESWTWQVTYTISETTTFEVWGHGTDPLGNPVDYNPEDPDVSFDSEFDTFIVEVNFFTRTQGFWATHLWFTEYIFDTYTGDMVADDNLGSIDLGWLPPITNIDDLMGVFWGNNAKNSDGSKRDALCQARMIASQQALAAILNSVTPGGAPLPAGYSAAEIAAILYGDDITAINTLNSVLDTYNNSGDDVAFDPSLPPTQRATPGAAKDTANIPFADCSNSVGLLAPKGGKK
ncbi:hypothetical protein [Dehalogenimonas etheniformans]|uniref:hypothetical protein n=1 Tax=Dehalogenimonas etheniformans TaxID=1536648 RepID=UPI0037496A6F